MTGELPPGAAESADSLTRDADLPRHERQHFIPMEHHLRDALAVRDLERLLSGVPHDDAPLVGKIRIDRARRVRNTEAFLERRSAPRPDLCLVAVRQARLESEWNQRHRARAQ